MLRRNLLVMGLASAALAACGAPSTRTGNVGLHQASVFRITEEDTRAIPYRMLESVNSLRRAAGAAPVQLDSQLTAAAATHSRDMAVQNRPWHFGSDGSSPLERLRRVGYAGDFVGEVISESFEDDATTFSAWMEDAVSREVILDPAATRLGVAWFQEPAGKIWWTMVFGH